MTLPESMRAIVIDTTGDLDVLQVKTLPVPVAAPGRILIKVAYGGVNLSDTYFRAGGLYPVKSFPYILGMEASGTVVALPTDHDDLLKHEEYKARGLRVGSKVAVCYLEAHAEYISMRWDKVFPLPDEVSLLNAAAATLQGLTVLTLLEEAYHVQPGDSVLIYTVAGGFGLLAAQYAKLAGAALVIGTTSTEEKAGIARAHGADHVILYTKENIVERVLELTGGKGVHVVYDGVGRDTFMDNFKLIRRKGTLVNVGHASGPVEPLSPLKLTEKNVKLVRPTFLNYVCTPEESGYYSRKLFDLIAEDKLKITIQNVYPFTAEGAKRAQTDLTSKGGSTVGKLVYKIGDD